MSVRLGEAVLLALSTVHDVCCIPDFVCVISSLLLILSKHVPAVTFTHYSTNINAVKKRKLFHLQLELAAVFKIIYLALETS